MRSIPEGEREDYAEYAWTLWAAEGMSTRMIAEHIREERKVSISHVTVAQLVKEGRDQTEIPRRLDVVKELHTATRHAMSLLYQDHRLGVLSTVELVRELVKLLERRARLFGADAPARVLVDDDRGLPAPSPEMQAILDDMDRCER